MQKKNEPCLKNTENDKDTQSSDSINSEAKTLKKNVESFQNEDVSNFLFVHGGMDTEGNVFDDLFFINLE